MGKGGNRLEIYSNNDKTVNKYVHNDGSETTIKTTSSCANFYNTITNKIEPVSIDRNKYSVFVSSSVGCPVGCKFCYLTVKKFPYQRLSCDEIIQNVKEAISKEVEANPEIRKKYIKLSFMGMGDAFFLHPIEFRKMVEKILKWAIGDHNYAIGIDGVDISTVLPKNTSNGWPHQLGLLNDYLQERYKNNNLVTERSIIRLFYSLHHPVLRHVLIPMANKHIINDLLFFNEIKKWYGIDVILHHMFLNGVNDSENDMQVIKTFMKESGLSDAELRILRYNECENSPYKESKQFDELVKLYAENFERIKYQISTGSEIKAACGQFIMK